MSQVEGNLVHVLIDTSRLGLGMTGITYNNSVMHSHESLRQFIFCAQGGEFSFYFVVLDLFRLHETALTQILRMEHINMETGHCIQTFYDIIKCVLNKTVYGRTSWHDDLGENF